jgi:UDP-2,4-diacetamido-2,4,6-trideoxy-beta-L-altropyranose hydrolase
VNIVFRTDASVQIGTGHVMRCLTLADSMRKLGANCIFICRLYSGQLLDLIRQRGHEGIALSIENSSISAITDVSIQLETFFNMDWEIDVINTQRAIGEKIVDWLIVDHYALDARWQKAMRQHCTRIMVIDDLADRIHDCDLLLNQNLGRSVIDYNHLIPQKAATLIGPRFALLRPEFFALRSESLARRQHPQLKHLLITMGGTDPYNVTEKVLHALRNCTLLTEVAITVVMGAHAPWLERVQAIALNMPYPTEVKVNVANMEMLMVSSDLAIAAAGGTIWELCALGIPTLCFAIAKNQESNRHALEAARATQPINLNSINQSFNNFFVITNFTRELTEIQRNASQICDGLGTSRVTYALMN